MAVVEPVDDFEGTQGSHDEKQAVRLRGGGFLLTLESSEPEHECGPTQGPMQMLNAKTSNVGRGLSDFIPNFMQKRKSIEGAEVTNVSSIVAKSGTQLRHFQVMAFTSAAAFCCFYTRSVLSVIIGDISAEYHLTPTEVASALGSFFYGYVVSNAVISVLLQRFQARWLILIAVLGSSFFTLVLPDTVAQVGFRGLVLCRICMGLTQGFVYPCAYSLISLELQSDPMLKTRALAILNGGAHLGIAANFLGSPVFKASSGGWQMAVNVAGYCGLPWCVLWVTSPIFRTPVLQQKEDDPEDTLTHSVSVRDLLAPRPVQAMVCGHFAHCWATNVIMAWLPLYLSQELHVAGKSMGLSCLPYLVMAAASPMAGLFAECLMRNRWDVWTVRRFLGAGGLLCPAAGLLLFPQIPETLWPLPLVVVSVVMAFTTWVSSSVMASPVDLAGPRLAGSLFSVSNTIGAIPGFVGVEVVGALREAYGWATAFGLCSVIYVLAAVTYLRCGSARRLFD